MVVRELLTRFGFSVDKSSMSGVEGSINRLSGMLGGLAAGFSLRAIANIADTMQSLEARIGMLPQTVGDVGISFDTMSKHATEARQSIEAYGTLYTRVGNAAKDYLKTQDDLLKVTDTISKALVVGGATMQEQSSVMIQFSQALGSGTLQGDEFRAMAEAAPQYLDALAKALGHPRSQLKKLASEGKITTKDIIKATLEMSNQFEDKFKKMPLTIGQGITQAMNQFSLFIARLNRETAVVSKVANAIIDNFDAIAIAIGAALTPLAVMAYGSAIRFLVSPVGLLIIALTALGFIIQDVYNYFNDGESALGALIERIKQGDHVATLLAAGLTLVAQALIIFGVQALIAGAKAHLGFLLALGPIGLLIGAIEAIIVVVAILWSNWSRITKGMGDALDWVTDKARKLFNLLGLNKFGFSFDATKVNPSQSQTAQGTGAGNRPSVDARQNINITVPAGTPESQQKFIEESAGKAFGEGSNSKTARALSVFGL